MPRIDLENVSLTFRVRQQRRTSLKDFMIGQVFRRSRLPITEVHALRNLSLRFEEGDRVGILGHNGSGKSTLLRLLAGIYPPSKGKVAVAGKISSLFDISLGFEADANGWENIGFRSYLQGETPSSIRGKIKQIAEFTELGGFLDMPVRYYSAGMMMRLAFAISTAIEPEILLVDEVLAVGDLAFQNKARERMLQMMDKSRLIVMVSHDLASIARFCNRAVWLDHGRVRHEGDVNEVIAAYTGSVRKAAETPERVRHADCLYLPAGDGSRTVTARVDGLPVGWYDVQATWDADPALADDAPLTIFDGSTRLATVRVNQAAAPFGTTDGTVAAAVPFQSLGQFYCRSGSIRVVLDNAAGREVVAKQVRVVEQFAGTVIDDGGRDFEQTGSGWRSLWNVVGGFGNHLRYCAPGIGANSACWTSQHLPGGDYDVYASWVSHGDPASNAPYSVYDGDTLLGTVRHDQKQAPTDLLLQGIRFGRLGSFPCSTGSLRVTLTDEADNMVIADAVCIAPARDHRELVASFEPEAAVLHDVARAA